MVTPREEAELIIKVLLSEFGSIDTSKPRSPPLVDGKEAIQWLRNNNLPYSHLEWPGFYIKHYLRHLLDSELPRKFEHFDPWKRLFLVKGEFSWDIRLKSSRYESPEVPFVDKSFFENYLEKNEGYGLLVGKTHFKYDKDGSFVKWHEEFKGGPSEYTKQRIDEERSGKVRKSAFFIGEILGFYLTREDLKRGLEKGWADPTFQEGMRQPSGAPRKGKYQLDIQQMKTEKCYLGTWMFNDRPKDFTDDYPEKD
ncbi:MAG: hypothetical protein ACFE9L_03825 [Candidatus Hodarchaeota archaeon]